MGKHLKFNFKKQLQKNNFRGHKTEAEIGLNGRLRSYKLVLLLQYVTLAAVGFSWSPVSTLRALQISQTSTYPKEKGKISIKAQ